MKGKSYRPYTTTQDLPRQPISHERPWVKEISKPKVYMWPSSIPASWIRIKGKKAFQHVSKTNNNKNTLDFCRENSKYIREISNPSSRSHSIQASPTQSAVTSRVQSPLFRKRQHPTGKTLQVTLVTEPTSSNLESPQSQFNRPRASIGKLKSALTCPIPEVGKKLLAATSVKTFNLEIPERAQTGYLVNQYSLPNGLASPKSSESSTKSLFRNKIVDDFLQRFNTKHEVSPALPQQKGLNGWKLVHLKSYKAH